MGSRMSIREPVGMALDTMRVHKMHSFLTLLGIILSVSTLIIVISLISGVNRYIQDRVANLGSNVFIVTRFSLSDQTEVQAYVKALRRNKLVTWDDYELLRDNLKLPLRIGAQVGTSGRVRFRTQTVEQTNIRGVTADMGDIDIEQPAYGRYITEIDSQYRSNVTMIGNDIATSLFPGTDPIGREVLIDGRPFTVVGVAKPIGSAMGQSQDNFAYIPIQTYLAIYGARLGIDIFVQARGADWMERTQDEARALMRARRHLHPDDKDSFGILDSASLMDLWKQLTGVIAMAMVGIVSVFLVIGGVVIMNVMLASVTDRTREIGIRKAVGARKQDILLQFLTESAFMAAMGGMIGVLIAYGIAGLVLATTSVPMHVPIAAVIVAELISAAVGMFFGVYPAQKAARLEPIEALRFEL
jgi:putative ABC transport system permease protein